MTVFDVVFRVRTDFTLERILDSGDLKKNLPVFYGNFDQFYQELSSEVYCRQQMNDGIVHCVRNQTFYCFFVWDQLGVLHLLNSRSEVKRFFQNLNIKRRVNM